MSTTAIRYGDDLDSAGDVEVIPNGRVHVPDRSDSLLNQLRHGHDRVELFRYAYTIITDGETSYHIVTYKNFRRAEQSLVPPRKLDLQLRTTCYGSVRWRI